MLPDEGPTGGFYRDGQPLSGNPQRGGALDVKFNRLTGPVANQFNVRSAIGRKAPASSSLTIAA